MDGRVSGPTGASSSAGTGNHATPPLVGRRDVLDRFTLLLDAIGDGTSTLIGLAGEPGAGKTRLLVELAAEAESRGMLPLWGRAAEFEQEMPFGAVVDALDDRLETLSTSCPSGWASRRPRCCRRVFPSLSARRGPTSPSRTEAGLGRYGVYRAVRRLLEELVPTPGSCSSSTTCTGPTRPRSSCSTISSATRRAGRS